MSTRKILSTFLMAALALPALAFADQAAKPITHSATAQVRATVVAVDQATRMVTLKGPQGNTLDVEAGPAVQHLDQFKPGDVVVATYTESLAFQVAPKGETPAGVSQSAKRTELGGVVGHEVTSSFKINSYDPNTHVLWVTTAAGQTKQITVQDPKAQERLKTLSPGTTVQVTYTESLAVKLEKAAK